jgi:hypothetical protein
MIKERLEYDNFLTTLRTQDLFYQSMPLPDVTADDSVWREFNQHENHFLHSKRALPVFSDPRFDSFAKCRKSRIHIEITCLPSAPTTWMLL